MKTIIEINEEVFQALEKIRKREKLKGRVIYYTLRRSNLYSKLNQGYWFYGSESYLAVSFWGGFDWKNRTPNIYFQIEKDGRTSLVISVKDSIEKVDKVQKYFIQDLKLEQQGRDVWRKVYPTEDYLQSLSEFINVDKIKIDEIINKNLNDLQSEDERNSFGVIIEGDFKKWLQFVNSYRRKQKSEEKAYVLHSISIRNFPPVMSLDINNIPLNAPFIIFVGENGTGKSSILQALATALGNRFYRKKNSPRDYNWEIKCSLYIKGVESLYSISSLSNQRRLKIPFAAFGPSRLVIDNRELRFSENRVGQNLTAPLYSIFNPDGILRGLNCWVLNMLNNVKPNQDDTEINLRFANLKKMLIEVIPNIYDIRDVKFGKRQELLYFEEDYSGNKMPKGVIFEHLSSGLKSMVAMIGDMMIRLFEQQPKISDPAELAGIVLIDEIDIHLHPNWQIDLPTILSKNFPKIQFIVTTHSPIPLLGAPEKSLVYSISRTSEKGISVKSLNYLNISNLLPNTILTSPIFGMDNIVSVINEDRSKVNVDDNYEDTESFKLLDKKMNKLSKNESMLNKEYFKK